MAHDNDTIEVHDEAMLAALAHPVRMRLLTLLRIDGPATASGLAGRIGESSGVPSYHLRRLAAAGFIEDAPGLGTRRERWWRASHRSTRWSAADFLGSETGQRASRSLQREALRLQTLVVEQYLSEQGTWGPAWVDACGWSDALLRLTAAQAKRLHERLVEVLRDADAEAPAEDDPDAERVVAFLHLVPIREFPW